MARAKIIVRIEKNGDTTVTTKGIKGPACLALTKPLEEALGTVVSSKPTKEMYERPGWFRKQRQPDGSYKRIRKNKP
jgi:hypothetical protein